MLQFRSGREKRFSSSSSASASQHWTLDSSRYPVIVFVSSILCLPAWSFKVKAANPPVYATNIGALFIFIMSVYIVESKDSFWTRTDPFLSSFRSWHYLANRLCTCSQLHISSESNWWRQRDGMTQVNQSQWHLQSKGQLCTANTTGWVQMLALVDCHGPHKLVVVSGKQNERPEQTIYQSNITKAWLKNTSVIVTCNVPFASEGVI